MTKLHSLSQNESVSLCVIVCVHNAPDYAEICIDSVLKHTHGMYDLVLVNDGSKSETTTLLKRYVRDYDHVRMIHHTTAKGYTKAANAGLRVSKADFTVLLNSDTIVSPEWSERMIACAYSEPHVGIVGPLSNAATYQSVPFVFEDNGTWKQNILSGDITVSGYAQAIARVSLKSYPRVPVANGFCFGIKREVIDTIGLLDEETFPRGYGEENDYCLRAADAGFEIAICDDAYVYHATSKSFGVKAREQLTREAHHAIRSKYSEERLNGIDSELRNHPAMDAVRKRVIDYVYHSHAAEQMQPSQLALPASTPSLSILFLMPDCSAKSGGTQVIVETARGLSQMGVPVKIAAKKNIKREYDGFFPADAHLFYYYEKDAELLVKAKDFNIAIATIFHSILQLKKMVDIYPQLMPAYYVQDYEPWFLDEHPKLKELAEASYTMVKHNALFAISPWVQDVIAEKHEVSVHKIHGSLDQSLFYPDYNARQESSALVISAMIRPSTPWRGPKQTMLALKTLKDMFGESIDIRIFGCAESEIEYHNLVSDFDYTNHGILNRHDVATLLRHSQLFLDLSEFQAFGRTALEAMACGCAVVAPKRGGVVDFGRDGQNILLADTLDLEACVEAASQLIRNDDLRERLSLAAIQTGLDYSIQRSTLSFLALMHQLKAADNHGKVRQAA